MLGGMYFNPATGGSVVGKRNPHQVHNPIKKKKKQTRLRQTRDVIIFLPTL